MGLETRPQLCFFLNGFGFFSKTALRHSLGACQLQWVCVYMQIERFPNKNKCYRSCIPIVSGHQVRSQRGQWDPSVKSLLQMSGRSLHSSEESFFHLMTPQVAEGCYYMFKTLQECKTALSDRDWPSRVGKELPGQLKTAEAAFGKVHWVALGRVPLGGI